MRWLQSISFSASPSSSSSSSASTSSSSFLYSSRTTSGSSPKNREHDGHRKSLSQNEQHNNQRHNHRRFRIIAPRLTRQRKLRHLTDQDLVPKKSQAEIPAESLPLSRSTSCHDQCTTASLPAHRSRSASIAVPLPLPLPDGEQRHLSPKELGHGKLVEDRIRDRDGDKAERPAASAPPTPISSTFAARDTRQTSENVDSRSSSSRVASQDVQREGSSRDAFRISVPPRSAPASPYASPALSPQRKSAAASDIIPIPYIIPGNQVWSAPEMQLDIPGLPPPAYFDYTAYTADNTPLHSPPNRSPRRDTRSPSGPASPLHSAKLSLEPLSTTMRSESNGPLSGHRLPLPPGAALPSPSSPPTLSVPMNNQWQKGKLIGRGTFGSVYVASNRETGALCAMKEVELFPDDPKSAECIKQLEQEIKILSQLKHPNIVQYYGSEIVEDRFYIYLEYVHPGSINKYVREHCGAMTESIVRNFTRHILCGLAYLHGTKTIHRDIKGANLLVDALGVVKLADFGMSKHLSGQRADLSLKGSPYWMAPELMQAVLQKDNNPDLALAVDIWSLGCTIIEMFTGKPPWSDYEGAAAMFKVMRDTPPIPETLSPEGKDFLRCCFRRNPAERATASMLLEHRFLKNSTQPCMKSADQPSPRETSDVKLDQLPLHPRSSKGGASESKTAQRSHHEVSNLRISSRHSPRSTLEAVPSLSPPHSGRNAHYC